MARVLHLPIVESDSCPRKVVFQGPEADAEQFFFDYSAREDVDEFYVLYETDIEQRLEELRAVIRDECISWGELFELQGLAAHIDPDDVELLEWAGVPEFPEDVDHGHCVEMGECWQS